MSDINITNPQVLAALQRAKQSASLSSSTTGNSPSELVTSLAAASISPHLFQPDSTFISGV